MPASKPIQPAESSLNELEELRRVREALRESEERLSFALETTHTGTWDLNLRDHSAHRSLEHDRIFGYAELLPQWTYEMFLEHVLPEDRPLVDTKFQQAMATGTDWCFECRIRRADQQVRWICAAGRHRTDSAGVRWGMAGTVQDITDRKRAEEATNAALDRFYSALSSITFATLLVNEQDRVEFANQAFCDLFNLKESPADLKTVTSPEILGMIGPSYLNPDKEIARIREIVARGVQVLDEEVSMTGERTFLRDFIPTRVGDNRFGRLWMHKNITDRKRAEEALRESRERLKLALISSRMATFDWDILHNKRVWSEGVHDLLGTNPQTFTGTAEEFFQIMHPDDRAAVQAALVRAVEGAGEYETEYRVVWPNGSIHHIGARGKVHRDPSGRAVLLTGVCWDITEQKHKETELQKLNRTLQALTESSQAMMRATSETEYLDQVCKNVIANCGYAMVWIGFAEVDEARTVRPVAHAGFEDGYLETLKITWADSERGRGATGAAIRSGKPCTCRNMLTDPAFVPWRQEALKRGYASSLALPLLSDGKAFGAITLYSREPDPFSEDETRLLAQLGDDVSYCIRSLRAVSRRQRAEAELRLLSTAVESAANGIAITDRDAQILWVNPAFTRLTGYTSAEVMGRNPRILKSGKNPPGLYHQMWTTLLKGEPWHGELVNRYKDGSLHYEEMTITPVQTSGTDITHFVAIKQDISERKRDEAALEQTAEEIKRSNQELEQFAYIASHDLQEPLRAIGGYVKLLQHRFPETIDAKALEYINGAVEGAARMERLITDLLAFSRVGIHGDTFSPVDLDAILSEALRNVQAAIESTHAKITRDAMPTLPVDATQVMQLFQNLIGNAIKFRSNRPPEIHVGARQEPDRWIFWVRDNGIGIEPQYFERIFQIFQRLHTRKEYPGTGIGLAICKKIVERHHGAIWVESNPGHGSTFSFSFPVSSSKNV